MPTNASPATGLPAAAHAGLVAEHFRHYNEEFGRITCRAAAHFLTRDWDAAQRDAVLRIELYEQRVAQCLVAVSARLQTQRTDPSVWGDIKRAYEELICRRPDNDFYRTFFNSVTRDLFGTVGVNPEVEFCATSVGRAATSSGGCGRSICSCARPTRRQPRAP
jgi:isocitrate dehydrogenase kinase/phosphatase